MNKYILQNKRLKPSVVGEDTSTFFFLMIFMGLHIQTVQIWCDGRYGVSAENMLLLMFDLKTTWE